MRVYCKVCGQRGRITKTNRLSDDVSDLYCQCTDAECGHSWVATLSFAHTISPSAKITNRLVLSLMGSLTPEGRQLVLQGLSGRYVWRWYSPDSCPQKGVVIRLQTG
ncbi:UNVERIFIED_ORG: Ogr/Delta-like zinc finger protein [Aeromonas veronii]